MARQTSDSSSSLSASASASVSASASASENKNENENENENVARIQRISKKARNMFASNANHPIPLNVISQQVRLAAKIEQEYANRCVHDVKEKKRKKPSDTSSESTAMHVDDDEMTRTDPSEASTFIAQMKHKEQKRVPTNHQAIVEYKKSQSMAETFGSTALIRRRPNQVPTPQWHAPWKLKRVISGHLGWVRAVAVDPTNDWFATGSADRSIKIWDLASGKLKLTLTGHINSIRGLAVSPRHPYLFSASEDKKVLCWDLEYNKVIRSYHGHLSGVYCLKLHPTLDILVTGGRDSVARVWDMRSKQQIHCLSGHHHTIWSVETQSTDPQIITGSMDCTVKLWDLAAGKVMTTLTNHKKAIRALVAHPKEYTFMSGAADNLKKWHANDGKFLRNFSGHNAIVNTLAVNQDDVMVSCADNGSMRFWDYKTGYCFQQQNTVAQPGSLDSEVGVYTSTFDKTGLRLITGEADKTIKIWQEDDTATEQTHPIQMKEWTRQCTMAKRY